MIMESPQQPVICCGINKISVEKIKKEAAGS